MGWNVLLSYRTMFIDIDFSFSETEKTEYRDETIKKEDKEFDLMSNNIEQVSEKYFLNFRVYKTYHGIRLICTNKLFYPEGKDTQNIFTEMLVDEGYRNCVLTDLCFFARLQPKTHRIDEDLKISKTVSFHQMKEEDQKKWLMEYKSAQKYYKVCEYICDFCGAPEDQISNPEIAKIIKIHDKLTRCFHSLPLA